MPSAVPATRRRVLAGTAVGRRRTATAIASRPRPRRASRPRSTMGGEGRGPDRRLGGAGCAWAVVLVHGSTIRLQMSEGVATVRSDSSRRLPGIVLGGPPGTIQEEPVSEQIGFVLLAVRAAGHRSPASAVASRRRPADAGVAAATPPPPAWRLASRCRPPSCGVSPTPPPRATWRASSCVPGSRAPGARSQELTVREQERRGTEAEQREVVRRLSTVLAGGASKGRAGEHVLRDHLRGAAAGDARHRLPGRGQGRGVRPAPARRAAAADRLEVDGARRARGARGRDRRRRTRRVRPGGREGGRASGPRRSRSTSTRP